MNRTTQLNYPFGATYLLRTRGSNAENQRTVYVNTAVFKISIFEELPLRHKKYRDIYVLRQ